MLSQELGSALSIGSMQITKPSCKDKKLEEITNQDCLENLYQ